MAAQKTIQDLREKVAAQGVMISGLEAANVRLTEEVRAASPAETVTAFRKKVTDLEDEIARLKRELAKERAIPGVSRTAKDVEREVARRTGKAPEEQPHRKEYCPCGACYQWRREQREAGVNP